MANKHMKTCSKLLAVGKRKSKNHNEIPLHTHRVARIKRQTITCVGEHAENLEPSYTAGWKVKWCSFCGTRFGSSSYS